MQYLKITDDMTLSQLSSRVGSTNVDSILNLYSLSRIPEIGSAYNDLVKATSKSLF